MAVIERINRTTGNIVKVYEVYKDEEIISIDGVLYIAKKDEYIKYINGEINTYEFSEAGFDIENEGDIFKIKLQNSYDKKKGDSKMKKELLKIVR